MKQAAGYVRVSTARQADDGDSLPAQKRQIELYAELHGMNLIEVYEERAVSAFKTPVADRPEGKRLIRAAVSGEIDTVIIARLDRFARNVRDLNQTIDLLQSLGVGIHFISPAADLSDTVGSLIVSIFGHLAQMESEATSERVKMTQAFIASEGRWTGGIRPFGTTIKTLTDGSSLVANNPEASAIRAGARMIINGGTTGQVADLWNGQGIKTTRGNPWTHNTVRSLFIKQERLWSGKTHHRGIPIPHPVILDKTTWDRVQATLRTRTRGKPAGHSVYTLSKILHCVDACGGHWRGAGQRKGGRRYTCSKGNDCPVRERRYLPAEEAEEFGWKLLFDMLDTFDADELFRQMAPASTDNEGDRIELAKLRRRVDRLNGGLVDARAELYIVEDEDRPQQEQVIARLSSQAESVQTQIGVIERRVGVNAASVEEQAAWLDASSRVDQWLSVTDKEEQRDWLKRLDVHFQIILNDDGNEWMSVEGLTFGIRWGELLRLISS